MSADQGGSSFPPAFEAAIDTVARAYFSPEEMAEAGRIYDTDGSYTEAIAYLVSCADDLRRSAAYCTIPGGKVHIPRPGRGADSVAYLSIPIVHLAARAFPERTQANDHPTSSTGAPGRQLGFWEVAVLGYQSSPPASVQQPKKTRRQKLTYVEQAIARSYGQAMTGWVVKGRGLGYIMEPMCSGGGYLVNLIHLKSKREVAQVIAPAEDHERIRAWVSACVLLTDWNAGIAAILKEKQGAHKQRAWSEQLEGIWREQGTQVKRQLTFF